jgi:hypothetical protein
MDSVILALDLVRSARAMLATPLFQRCLTVVRGRP